MLLMTILPSTTTWNMDFIFGLLTGAVTLALLYWSIVRLVAADAPSVRVPPSDPVAEAPQDKVFWEQDWDWNAVSQSANYLPVRPTDTTLSIAPTLVSAPTRRTTPHGRTKTKTKTARERTTTAVGRPRRPRDGKRPSA